MVSAGKWLGALELTRDAFVAAGATTRAMLFHQSCLPLWIPVGLVAFLDQIGAGNLQFASRLATTQTPPGQTQWSLFEPAQVLSSWVEVAGESPHLLVFYVLGFLGLAALSMAVLTGIGSLGQLMFMRLASTQRAAVWVHAQGAWPRVRSLWAFRLALFAVSFVLFIPFFITGMLWAAQAGSQGVDTWTQLARILAPLAALWSVVGMAFLAVNSITRNLVVPIMDRRACDCLEAWGETLRLFALHARPLVAFFVLRFFVLAIFATVATVISYLLCCLGFFPIVHHILFAPYYLFDRAFGVEVLARLDASLAPAIEENNA